jgi:hypothetical protein
LITEVGSTGTGNLHTVVNPHFDNFVRRVNHQRVGNYQVYAEKDFQQLREPVGLELVRY